MFSARARAKKMESKCTVIFFDEIDALGRSRVDEGNGGESKSGGDHSSRRVLAELLIQMTDLSSMNGEDDGGESECDEDYDGYCDDSSFACQSTLSGSEVVVACHDGNLNERAQALNAGDKVRTTPRVIVIAATNRPEDCDPALLRRFAVRVLVGLPTKRDRKKIIKRLLKDVDHTVTADQLDELADATEGWSGSDLGECQLSISCAISLLLCIVLLF
jgi:SpoVK/Ycf46/Vps4 family AAA+-type ATPase